MFIGLKGFRFFNSKVREGNKNPHQKKQIRRGLSDKVLSCLEMYSAVLMKDLCACMAILYSSCSQIL